MAEGTNLKPCKTADVALWESAYPGLTVQSTRLGSESCYFFSSLQLYLSQIFSVPSLLGKIRGMSLRTPLLILYNPPYYLFWVIRKTKEHLSQAFICLFSPMNTIYIPTCSHMHIMSLCNTPSPEKECCLGDCSVELGPHNFLGSSVAILDSLSTLGRMLNKKNKNGAESTRRR